MKYKESIEDDYELVKDVLIRQNAQFVLGVVADYECERAKKISFNGRELLRISLIKFFREMLKQGGLK